MWHIGFIFSSTSMLGLVLIATGTGGIKPCVAAFGGDQVQLLENSFNKCNTQPFYILHTRLFKNRNRIDYLFITRYIKFSIRKRS